MKDVDVGKDSCAFAAMYNKTVGNSDYFGPHDSIFFY